PTPIRVSVEEVPSPSSPPQSSTSSASPQPGSVNQPLSSSAGRKGAISSNTSIGRESTGRNSISHQLAQLIHQLNGNSQPPTEKITITSQKPKGRVSPSPISTLPTSPSGRPKKGGKNSSPIGVKPLILTKKGDRIVIIPYKASDLNPAERIHTQYLHRQVERKAKQETRKVTLTSQWKSIPGTSSSPKSPHSPMGTPKEVVNIPLISQGKGGATPKVAKVAKIKITTSQIGSPPPGFTASSSSYKGGNKPIQPLSHPSQLSATNYNSTTSTSVTTPPPSPPLKSVAPVSPTLHFQAQYRSIYLDKPQPISLLEVAGKSFVVRENYTDNAPFLFQFGGDGIARVYYKNRPLVIQLVNGIIYVYDKSGRVLAYFQKVASDPVVGLVLIGHSLNRQGKVEQTWLDFWQYADYTPTKVDIRTLLPYRIFNSWTSQWYRQFWGNGIVDFYIYDPRYRSYRQYTNAPYSIIHGDLLVQDGSLLKMGNKLLQNSYTETISQIAQVGRYRIVAVTFSSFKEVQDPALFNKSWHDLIGKYWIDNWFRLLPNGQIEFVSGEEGRGYYRISGNVLEVTFVWNGKYLYSDRYLLDPTAGTIRNSFVTQFWDIVSPQPIVALTPSQQKLPTTNSNLLKKLYIDAYIHHLKRKHFF
ncbi:MAG: hypothetical protein GXO13_04720, partial [Epsilonproteobacteria bacterium]|nr:hypothetical protein [Campylobacterota bacterium]